MVSNQNSGLLAIFTPTSTNYPLAELGFFRPLQQSYLTMGGRQKVPALIGLGWASCGWEIHQMETKTWENHGIRLLDFFWDIIQHVVSNWDGNGIIIIII